jgi:hypothetical protein
MLEAEGEQVAAPAKKRIFTPSTPANGTPIAKLSDKALLTEVAKIRHDLWVCSRLLYINKQIAALEAKPKDKLTEAERGELAALTAERAKLINANPAILGDIDRNNTSAQIVALEAKTKTLIYYGGAIAAEINRRNKNRKPGEKIVAPRMDPPHETRDMKMFEATKALIKSFFSVFKQTRRGHDEQAQLQRRKFETARKEVDPPIKRTVKTKTPLGKPDLPPGSPVLVASNQSAGGTIDYFDEG